MTKPQDILLAANRVLRDQTAEAATVEVQDIIVPTFDILRLDAEPRVFDSGHVMIGIFRLSLTHGVVPLGEVWEYEELFMNYVGTATETFTLDLLTSTGNVPLRITEANNLLATGRNSIDLLRHLGHNLSENARPSTRRLRIYPGMSLQLTSVTALAAGDTVDFSGIYNRLPAPKQQNIIDERGERVTEIEF